MGPAVKHYGDITKLSGYELPAVDCITGGSPCQDLSVAGKRAGLDGERSGLFMEQIRIVKEMRERDRANGRTGILVRPRYMVWENVPGAFSSNGGKDFQAVLTEIVRVAEPESPDVPLPEKGRWPKAGCLYDDMGRWSIAWRVHDAQFWGVPQRRKRIALVADFGGLSASEICFVRKGLSGDHQSREAEGQETAGTTGESIDSPIPFDTTQITSKYNYVPVVAHALSARHDGSPQPDKGNGPNIVAYAINQQSGKGGANDYKEPLAVLPEPILLESNQNNATIREDGISTCLPAGAGMGGGHVPMISSFYPQMKAESQCFRSDDISVTLVNGTNPGFQNAVIDNRATGLDVYNQSLTGDVSKSLTSISTDSDHTPCVMAQQAFGDYVESAQASALKQRDYKDSTDLVIEPTKAYGLDRASYNQGKNAKFDFSVEEEKIGAQTAKGPGAVYSNIVRRLTPLECERLQGYPSGWTDIGEWIDSKGKKHKEADSPRYKALGNSIALPFWFWLLRRISAQYERPATLGSLFDGIGGFPLCWERCNGKGTAIWASEIEEFPIAVTKLRFPEEEI